MKNDIRPEMNKKYNTISLYVLAISAIIIILAAIVMYIVPVSMFVKKVLSLMNPFFYAFAIAFLLKPICAFFERLFSKNKHLQKFSSALGLITTYVLFLSCLTLFISIIIPQAAESVRVFSQGYRTYIRQIENFFKDNIPSFSSFFSESFITEVENKIISLLERLLQLITDFSPKIFSAVSDFAVSLWNIVLGLIISVYMLAERKNFARQLKRLTYALFEKHNAQKIIRASHITNSVFGNFVTGKVLEATLIGVLCFIGTSILKIPYAPLVSVIVGVTDVIPYFGPFLGGVPSFIIIFLSDPIKAIWFAIFILILQQIDGNLIGPKILKETIGLSSFWIIFSLIVMGGLFGVVGMILAVPMFALMQMAISRMCNVLLDKKGHPELQSNTKIKTKSNVKEESAD